MLDPLSSYFAADLAMDPYWLRNYDEALLQMNRVLAMDPQFATTHMNLAYIYAAKGDSGRAIAAAKRSRELDPQNPFMVSTLAYVYGRAGQPQDAQRVLDQLSAMARRHPVSDYHFAFAHLGLGHRQQSMDFFMKAYDERFYALAAINIMPDVDILRSDPRFGQLLRLMGVPQ